MRSPTDRLSTLLVRTGAAFASASVLFRGGSLVTVLRDYTGGVLPATTCCLSCVLEACALAAFLGAGVAWAVGRVGKCAARAGVALRGPRRSS